MNELNISLARVSETAEKIRTLSTGMYDELNEIKREMDALDLSWLSDAGEEIRSRFRQFAVRFDKQKELVDAYAGFLELTVSSYDSLETAMTGNASGIQV